MTSSRKIVRAFLASPGDLVQERKIAKRVVDEFNNSWADQLGCQVELVGWERTVTSFGRPQELINRDLAGCELFIGMMWKRWGTPPDTTGMFTSGFEEEFKTSVERRKRGENKPEINLFFKDVDPELVRDPGPELRKVLDFKAQLIDEKIVLFETFGSEEEFREKVQRCITHYVQSVINADNAVEREREEPRSSEVSGSRPVETISSTGTLSGEAAKFLLEIAPRVERREGAPALGSVEVARLRLIGAMEQVHGNDEHYLGVHDINILFANRNVLKLEDREYFALVGSGLEYFSSENAPLWFWIATLGAKAGNLLVLYSRHGSASHRAAAISAMRTTAEPITLEAHTREQLLGSWLGPDIDDIVKASALSYLADFGNPSDLPAIRAEFDRDNRHTRTEAVEALLRINMRESRVRAVKALIELQPLSVDVKLLDELFGNEGSLSTPLLLDVIKHRNPKIREIAAGILRQRNALSVAVAEELLSDEDASVRYEALRVLHESGKRYSDEEASRSYSPEFVSGPIW
ncbi:DUF4062 domain-containing protein [Microvirga tunisiensis]|uniref:DUF4062 domain-containing protein n=1 Tax=Microvirga tunisiensis TaxID=2108360 RepID=A0A5N7MW98_9HYPH|nr:DUF4062 domain-containing protein [Microvirga tunisiensis]MPR13386.1 DUF4062 domain-containing protein [Microvirga tunisiensis]MPR31255.1 DUF4062 domain-containing protein [Microvirga tunisiensis]